MSEGRRQKNHVEFIVTCVDVKGAAHFFVAAELYFGSAITIVNLAIELRNRSDRRGPPFKATSPAIGWLRFTLGDFAGFA